MMSKLDNWLQETVTIGKKKAKVKKEKKEEEKKKINLYMMTVDHIVDLETKIREEKDEDKIKELKKEQTEEKDRAVKMYATRGDVMKSGVTAGCGILVAVVNILIPLGIYLGILSKKAKDPNDTQFMEDDHDRYSVLRVLQDKLKNALSH